MTAEAAAGQIVFRAANLPAGSEASVQLSLAGDNQLLPGGIRVLIRLPALAVLPLQPDGRGGGSATFQLPRKLAVGEVFAQLACRRQGTLVATSAGLRVRPAR